MEEDRMNYGQWLNRWASHQPEKIAIKYNDLAISWMEFNSRTNQAALALQKAGVRKGDRLALLLANGNVYLEFLFAASKLGVILAPLNFRLAASELMFIVNDSEPCMLIYSPEFSDQAKILKDECASINTSICEMNGALEGDVQYEEWIRNMPAAEPVPDSEVVLDDPAMIMYTSGTTGRPKGALLTQGNIFWNCINSQHSNCYDGHEISLCNAPLFHIGALNISALPVVYVGGMLVIQRNFDPGEALRLIDVEKVTLMFGVPAMFQFMTLVPEWNDTNFSSVEMLVAGGATVPKDMINTYTARGTQFIQGYGMTESAAGISILEPEFALSKIGSAGRPLFHLDLKIIGQDNNILGTNQIGEIVIKGPNVIGKYWRMPDESAKTIVDGWLHTGDMGYLDKDGFLFITDRKKDMYISGGENVYPAEVEMILSRYPKISEIAVIGIPDEKWGETGIAIVKPIEGESFSEEDFLAFCAKELAGYKRPKKIVVTEQPLPKTSTGKLMKKELKKLYGKTT